MRWRFHIDAMVMFVMEREISRCLSEVEACLLWGLILAQSKLLMGQRPRDDDQKFPHSIDPLGGLFTTT